MKINLDIDTTSASDLETAARIVAALRTDAWPQTFTANIPDEVRERAAEPEPAPEPAAPEKPKRASRAKKAEPVVATLPESIQPAEEEIDDTPMVFSGATDEEREAEAPSAATAAAEEPASEFTLKDLQEAGKALITSGTGGRDKLKGILDEYDVGRLSDLHEDAFAQVIAKIEAATK